LLQVQPEFNLGQALPGRTYMRERERAPPPPPFLLPTTIIPPTTQPRSALFLGLLKVGPRHHHNTRRVRQKRQAVVCTVILQKSFAAVTTGCGILNGKHAPMFKHHAMMMYEEWRYSSMHS